MNISVEQTSTIFFALAVVHTFLASQFQKFSHKFPKNSVKENIFHLLGEVEVVFGLWAGLYILFLLINQDFDFALNYLNSRNFTEPIFVFVVMSVCSTKPILNLALSIIESLAKLLPFNRSVSFFAVTLTVGPILGSFITEPAAMTVTALVLYQRYYSQGLSRSLMYSTLGVLFVNVSVGGTLTPYAAPPVIMVSSQWGWDLHFMLTQFGWKGVLACLLSTAFLCLRYRKELAAVKIESAPTSTKKVPPWIVATHVLFLALIVLTAHYMVFFTGLFLFFIGLYVITKTYQDSLDLKAGLLVAFFLGGLVVLGGPQGWWVEPTIRSLDSTLLFLSSIGLTAMLDNAALTYLGSQVPNLADLAKYYLVAGAVVGGGLTVIANAPNPAGFGILNPAFKDGGISPVGLFLNALIPTLIAGSCFYFL